jgi:hypothetical protein
MRRYLLLLISTIFLFAFTAAQDENKKYSKILTDDNSKFTDVGNISITVTNFGVYGHAFSLWPQQP